MARNTLRLETKGFERMLKDLEAAGGDVKKAVDEAFTKASAKITQDTKAAMANANLPARGQYSDGTTLESIIQGARVEWEGFVASIPVGFDFSKPGAGGFLITGTPKMQPDKELHKMYKQKKYMSEIQKDMSDVIMDHLIRRLEG